MMRTSHRFTILAAVVGLLAVLFAAPTTARRVTDSADRTVEVPDTISRVFAAGPPASILLYTLAPQDMVGWVRTPHAAAKPFLLPSVQALPELGRLTGRGDTLNLERLLAAKPDVIIDFGTINDTYRSLADRVQTQTGIPYILIDGRFENTPAALRLLADVLGVGERGSRLADAASAIFSEVDHVLARVPQDKRPRVYLARGPEGLETGSRGSINTEIIEWVGAVNVVDGLRQKGGIANASLEQVLTWRSDTIVTLDPRFTGEAIERPQWAVVPAVAEKRVFLAPSLPFGFVDAPPSINRLIGLTWLLHRFYPAYVEGNLHDKVRSFYHLFYQVDLDEPALAHMLHEPRN
jgi:iron complex transport system substrate-binding protein